MLLPQSLLMSLLASYKKEAFGQGAAHRPGRAQGLSRHHGRPLRVGTRRAGAVGGVADARAPPRGSGSLHLGPAPPHARHLGLPGLSGSGHRELRVRGWGIEPSPRSFPTLTCDVLRTCKLGIGNGGPTDRHARPRVASGGHVAYGSPAVRPTPLVCRVPSVGMERHPETPPGGPGSSGWLPPLPQWQQQWWGALKGLGLWPGRLGKPLSRLSAQAAKRAKCRAPPEAAACLGPRAVAGTGSERCDRHARGVFL